MKTISDSSNVEVRPESVSVAELVEMLDPDIPCTVRRASRKRLGDDSQCGQRATMTYTVVCCGTRRYICTDCLNYALQAPGEWVHSGCGFVVSDFISSAKDLMPL